MKKIGIAILVMVSMVFVFGTAEPLSAQQYVNGVPCSRAKRMTAGAIGGGLLGALVGGLAGGNRKGIAIGAAIGGGAIAAASVHTPRGCQEKYAQNSQGRKRHGRRSVQEAPPAPAPSLRGQKLAIQFAQGYANGGISDAITSFALHAWSSLGATVLRQPLNANWNQSPCEVPGEKVVCVTYGAPVPYNGGSSYGNMSINPPRSYISTGGGESAQLYAVTVNVDVYDNANVSVNQWGQRVQGQPMVTALAAITIPDTAGEGSQYLNVGIGGRVNFGSYNNMYSYPQLAQLGASNHATADLVQGYGWLPNAEADLASR